MPRQDSVPQIKISVGKVRLTDLHINTLPPREKTYVVKDAEVKQLRVIVQPTGSKSFYVQYGQKKRKVGDVNSMSVQSARLKAIQLLAVGLDRNRLAGKTLRVAFDEYLSSREFSKGFESNLNQAKRIFSRLLNRSIQAVSKDDIASAIVSARKANGEALAGSTKDSALNVLSSVFTYQIALEAMEGNPVKNVKARIPKLIINKRANRLSDEKEFGLFVDWFEGGLSKGSGVSVQNVKDFDLIKLAVLFLVLTGARIGEVIGLRKEDFWMNSEGDVDSDGGRKMRTVTFRQTKNGRDHSLQLTNHANAVLMRALKLTSSTNPYIFRCEARGEYITDSAMYSRVEKSLRKIEIKGHKLRPHDLRRTFAFMATKAGLSKDEIGVVLNHSTGSITERYQGELTEMTFDILKRYEDYLNRFITKRDSEFLYSGLGLISGSRAGTEKQLLSEVEEWLQTQSYGYDDFYEVTDSNYQEQAHREYLVKIGD